MFSGADFAGPIKALRNAVVIIIVVLLLTIGAFWHRVSVQWDKEAIAQCIIDNVDYRPNEGLRTYCENLHKGGGK